MKRDILYKELSDLVIKIAIEVQKELGTGFLEKVYENAMGVRFKEEKILNEQQKKIEVYFHRQLIGEFFADMVVEKKLF